MVFCLAGILATAWLVQAPELLVLALLILICSVFFYNVLQSDLMLVVASHSADVEYTVL